MLPSKEKQALQRFFRKAGVPRLFVYRTFMALVFLLVKPHLGKITHITIDIEYRGQEGLLKNLLLEHIRTANVKDLPTITFKEI